MFNIMQEGDVQIKGYPLRLPLDVALVFTANPEDYTARGKIVTPLKDRIGSEIRTHYPGTLEEGISITEQEAWLHRDGLELHVPKNSPREVVERVAFLALDSPCQGSRSGLTPPISTSVPSTPARSPSGLGSAATAAYPPRSWGELMATSGEKRWPRLGRTDGRTWGETDGH